MASKNNVGKKKLHNYKSYKSVKKDSSVAVLGMLMRGLEPGVTTSSTNSLQHDRRRGPELCSSRALRHVNNGIYYTGIYTVQLYRYSCTAVLHVEHVAS